MLRRCAIQIDVYFALLYLLTYFEVKSVYHINVPLTSSIHVDDTEHRMLALR